MKPFIRWCGGKFSVIDPIVEKLEELKGDRVIDVFAGGGAIFLNAPQAKKVVCDINPHLINCYRDTAADPDGMINTVSSLLKNYPGKEGYYAVRDMFNQKDEIGLTWMKSAQFIYLNRTCFNGLFRVNKKYKFNTPYGYLKNPYVPSEEIKYFASMAAECEFICQGYQRSIELAGEGDVVVCDPPYMPLEGKDSFTAYHDGEWRMAEQTALVDCLLKAHQRGASVLIFNSDSDLIRDLYKWHGFEIYDLPTRRSIGATGAARGVSVDIMGVLRNGSR